MRAPCGDDTRVVGPVDGRLEHHPEQRRAPLGELDVGAAQRRHVRAGAGEVLAEHAVPLRGDRGQQAGLVAEALADGGVADAGARRDLTQARRGDAVPGDLVLRGGDGGDRQVAVVIGLGRRHASRVFTSGHGTGTSVPATSNERRMLAPIRPCRRRVIERCGSAPANARKDASSSHTDTVQNVA